MTQQIYSLGEVARKLNMKPHIINYALTTGRIPEVRKVGHRRVFTNSDLARIAEIMGCQFDLESRGKESHEK